MRFLLTLVVAFLVSRCTATPEGVVFRCEADAGCPDGYACRLVGADGYCFSAMAVPSQVGGPEVLQAA
jgi:hypothetical protein